jgi:AraC-like DNA-binding protein
VAEGLSLKHQAGGELRYRPVPGMAGLDMLRAERLQLRFDRHFHETYSFGLVDQGIERCGVGRDVNFYEPGTVPLFNPGEVHDGGPASAEGWSYRMLYADPALVASLCGGEPVFRQAARRDELARRRVREVFDAAEYGSTLGIDEALRGALEALLGLPSVAGDAVPAALARVRERIDAECCEPLRLRDLCVEAGVSPARLLRGFAKAYGLTPHRYQQSRRMAHARRLIAAGTPLPEIAAACGYADQSHLNRWFHRVYGTTPGRFRRAFFS